MYNRATPVSGDGITKIIRNHFKPANVVPYQSEVVQCRTNTSCLRSKPEDYWVQNYLRRKDNLTRGTYTNQTEPYIPLGGDVSLDPYELIVDTLPGSIDKRYHPRANRRGLMKTPEPDQNSESKKSSSCSTEIDLDDDYITGGYDDIQTILRESTRRGIAMRAGMPYTEHLRKSMDLGVCGSGTSMVIQSMSSLIVPVQHVAIKSSRGTASAESITDLASDSGSKLSVEQVESDLSLASTCETFRSSMPSPLLTIFPSIINAGLQKKQRQCKDHHLYLQSIYQVLCALHNIRNKDLRSKTPLCREYVVRIQREILKDEDRFSRATYTSPWANKSVQMSSSTFVMMGEMPDFTRRGISKRLAGGDTSRNVKRMSPMVETWEDLLNVQETSPGLDLETVAVVSTKVHRWFKSHHAEPFFDDSDRPNSIEVQKGRLPGQMERHVDDKEPVSGYGQSPQVEKIRRLPLWQLVAQEKSMVFRNKAKVPCPETLVHRMRKAHTRVKKSVYKENCAILEKMLRERDVNFRLKLSALDPVEAGGCFFRQMKKIQKLKESWNQSHFDAYQVEPSKWFEELRNRTFMLIHSYDQPQLSEMMTKLKPFSNMDMRTVQNAKAKLCLLMMSLPAYDLCQIYIQRALKFVFEEILFGEEAQFFSWLNERKIPYMLVNDGLIVNSAKSGRDSGSSSQKHRVTPINTGRDTGRDTGSSSQKHRVTPINTGRNTGRDTGSSSQKRRATPVNNSTNQERPTSWRASLC